MISLSNPHLTPFLFQPFLLSHESLSLSPLYHLSLCPCSVLSCLTQPELLPSFLFHSLSLNSPSNPYPTSSLLLPCSHPFIYISDPVFTLSSQSSTLGFSSVISPVTHSLPSPPSQQQNSNHPSNHSQSNTLCPISHTLHQHIPLSSPKSQYQPLPSQSITPSPLKLSNSPTHPHSSTPHQHTITHHKAHLPLSAHPRLNLGFPSRLEHLLIEDSEQLDLYLMLWSSIFNLQSLISNL